MATAGTHEDQIGGGHGGKYRAAVTRKTPMSCSPPTNKLVRSLEAAAGTDAGNSRTDIDTDEGAYGPTH